MENKKSKKSKLIKPYFVHRGKRYGMDNEIEIFGKKLPLFLWNWGKETLMLLAFSYGFCLLSGVTHPDIFGSAGAIGILYCLGQTVFFFPLKVYKRLSCLYCAENMVEIEHFIEKEAEKNRILKDKTEIIYEDGWYMLFAKNQTMSIEEKLQQPNVYLRECPGLLKKCLDNRFIGVVGFGGLFLSIGVYFLCTKVFSLSADFADKIMYLPLTPLMLIVLGKNELTNAAIREFRKKENFPYEEYDIRVGSYRKDKKDEIKLVFTVTPKNSEEKKDSKEEK